MISEREHYTILDLEFGHGERFVERWRAWRTDVGRPARLFYFALLTALPCYAQLPPELREAWVRTFPEPQVLDPLAFAGATPDELPALRLRLSFDQGQVQLYVCTGARRRSLKRLELRADEVLGGPAPSRPSVTGADLHPVLGSQKYTGAQGRTEQSLVILGAGLAGAALANQLKVWHHNLTVVDQSPSGELTGSSQPVCIEHLHVSPDDNVLARLARAAWQLGRSGHWYDDADAQAPRTGTPETLTRGKLMLLRGRSEYERWRVALQRLLLPPNFLRLLDRSETLALAQWPPLQTDATLSGALYFVDARAFDPQVLCRNWLTDHPATPPIKRLRAQITRLIFAPDSQGRPLWQLWDDADQLRLSAATLVLCNAANAKSLQALSSLPVNVYAGQSSMVRTSQPVPSLALGSASYLCPLDDRRFAVGANFESPDRFKPNAAHDQENLRRLAAGLALSPAQLNDALGQHELTGHPGIRCNPIDRMPIIGPWPDERRALVQSEALLRNAKLALPMLPGLYANFGYGARGMLWCVLGAELLSAQLRGEPSPLSAELEAAISPARKIRSWLRSRSEQAASTI